VVRRICITHDWARNDNSLTVTGGRVSPDRLHAAAPASLRGSRSHELRNVREEDGMCSELPRGAGVARRLRGYLSREGLPGLRSRLSKNRFLHELGLSSRKYRAMRIRRCRGSTDPSDSDFHPYSAICELARAGNAEEAIWLSVLTIVCGHVRGQENHWESVRCLYGGFGSTRWTWERVRAHPGGFREWMVKRRDDVRRLRFGNHRKYETHDPMKRGAQHTSWTLM
jgi:hypothetical protein